MTSRIIVSNPSFADNGGFGNFDPIGSRGPHSDRIQAQLAENPTSQEYRGYAAL